MFLELFLFAKKSKFLTKGGIHRTFRSSLAWHFYFMRGHSLVELTEHDDSAADIPVHSMYMLSQGIGAPLELYRLPCVAPRSFSAKEYAL